MRIGVLTATRAEYGILKPLISRINDDKDTELVLIVTGTHLLSAYGDTVRFIEEDGFPIAERIPIEMETGTPAGISRTMGQYFNKFADVFQRQKIDFLVVLGDRYELIPICFCAVNARIPIGHISGGEITEGAIDDTVRHCVTKMSYLHFPACETYRKRIIQLGENPARVFNVGDPGVENIQTMDLLREQDVRSHLGLPENGGYYVVVFHPETLSELSPAAQVKSVLDALDAFPEYYFVFLKPNADAGGAQIDDLIASYNDAHKNCIFVSSLRISEFLSLQKYSMGLIGNSSSGIVETPCFGIPTINVGDRQKGRLFADSIVSCTLNKLDIIAAIRASQNTDFREKARNTVNPYGSGDTSAKILSIIKNVLLKGIDLKKYFYDI